jgi:4-amino-4-deoxy-L-arabinose transferase-like glycosyltransferase
MQYISKLGGWALLAAVAAVTAGWGLGEVELNGHECYVALAARAMTSTGQWLDDHLFEQPIPEATTFNRWMVPQDNGLPRLRKTPLAYWAAAGMVMMGLPLDEATIRLPSVIASVLTVLVIFGVGRRMIGQRAALMGALMLAASLGTLKWGRNARPELLLMLWMTVAMACFWTGMQAAGGAKRAAWLMAGWAAMGLANLSKEFVPLFLAWPLLAYLAWRASILRDGRPRLRLAVFLILALAGVVLVDLIRRAMLWWNIDAPEAGAIIFGGLIGLPLAGYFLVCRPWGQIKLVLPTLLPGLVLMALLFVPWLVYLDKLFPATSDTLWQQVGARGVGSEDWTSLRTPGFYLSNMVVLTLPWTIFLPGAVLAPLLSVPARRPGADEHTLTPLSARRPAETPQNQPEHVDGLVYMLLWVFGLMLLFSAAAGKRVHYILPAMPALCMLAGYAAQDVFFRHRWFSLGQARAIIFGYAILGVLAVGAAAVASRAASGGWIAHGVARVLGPVMGKISPGDIADIGRQFLVPTAVVAAVLLASTLAMIRNKPALSFAGLVAAVVALMFSLAGRAELVNESPHAAREVRWIRGSMPAPAPISFWGPNNRTEPLVYYFGHDLPDAALAREAMTARYGKQDGLRRWEAWMRQDGGRWLLVCAKDVDEVKKMGYTIVDPNHTPLDENMDVILFQPPAKSR